MTVPEKESTMRVMLLGRLENPKVKCHRALHHNESGSDVLNILVKRKPANQSFKIPFKNLSLGQDAEVEFAFLKIR